jgi:hypothetical protein
MDITDQLDLDSFRLPQDFTNLVGVKKVLLTVPLRKPHKHEFFRTHPTWEFPATVLKTAGDKRDDLYVVASHLLPIVADDIVPMMFVATVTRQETFFLWPLRLPNADGRQDDWSRSALLAMAQAKTQWLRMVSKRALSAYEIYEPVGNFGEPVWPTLDWPAILQLAFRDHVIEDADHPVLRQLRGEV